MKPVCSACKSNVSSMWTKGSQGEILCNSCVTKSSSSGKDNNGTGPIQGKKNNGNGDNGPGPVLRKSSRSKPSKYRLQNSKPLATKGKNRRVIFKKSQPMKAPTAVATVVTGQSVYHDCMYYQVGDIVSLVDDEGDVYYAQIRGFLQDQYYEKSAVITWLLPTSASSKEGFDPSTYILGPEEDLPRKLEYMEFVCHAPSDYFKANLAPYPTVNNSPELCYVWSHAGPEIRVAPTMDEIFSMNIAEGSSPPKRTKAEKLKAKEAAKLLDVV